MRPMPSPRRPDADVDPRFPDRWSPRAFAPDPVPEADLEAIFEAARWAPSAMNEQPWVLVYAAEAAPRGRLLDALVPFNQVWARHAPVLVLVATRRHFARNGQPNRWAAFDAGAAWMALALAARARGLHTHSMGGFDADAALQTCGLDPEQYEALAVVALGRRAAPATLPEELRDREQPSERKPLADVAYDLAVGPPTLP